MMPVELKSIGGKLRTVEEGSRRLARNNKGTPIDGGGWPNSTKGQATGGRQVQHVNEGWQRKHGRIS